MKTVPAPCNKVTQNSILLQYVEHLITKRLFIAIVIALLLYAIQLYS